MIHCAARSHVMHETEADALAVYRSVDVDGSRRLAEQAAAVGVRRLVYLSSIKVNGEQTAPGAPFCFRMRRRRRTLTVFPNGKPSRRWRRIRTWRWWCARAYGPRVNGNFLRFLQCRTSARRWGG